MVGESIGGDISEVTGALTYIVIRFLSAGLTVTLSRICLNILASHGYN